VYSNFWNQFVLKYFEHFPVCHIQALWISTLQTRSRKTTFNNPLQKNVEELGLQLDPFDLICHIAYDQPPMSRRERAARVQKQGVYSRYGPQARAVLEALLAKYQDVGVVDELADVKILRIPPFSAMGTQLELLRPFGSKAGFERAVHDLQTALYAEAA